MKRRNLTPGSPGEMIDRALETFSEDEALTDQLDDAGGQALLKWGAQYIKGKSQSALTAAEINNRARYCQKIIRAANKMNKTRRTCSDGEFVAQILDVVKLASLRKDLLSAEEPVNDE